LSLVDNAVLLITTCVLQLLANSALEEAFATFAAVSKIDISENMYITN